MSNLDNQPDRNSRAGLNTGTTNNGVDDRRTGLGAPAITAIIAAVLIAGALMLFGPWSNNRTAVNTTPSCNSTTGTTTGQSTAPRVITPAAPPTTAPAPTTR